MVEAGAGGGYSISYTECSVYRSGCSVPLLRKNTLFPACGIKLQLICCNVGNKMDIDSSSTLNNNKVIKCRSYNSVTTQEATVSRFAMRHGTNFHCSPGKHAVMAAVGDP